MDESPTHDRGVSPVNVQPFLGTDENDGLVFGFDQGGVLYAVELPSGKRIWDASPISERPRSCETAFLVKQADRFWMSNDHGELMIARLTRDGYQEIDRAKVIEPTNTALGRDVVGCMPAFAHQRMFVRNDDKLICVDLAKQDQRLNFLRCQADGPSAIFPYTIGSL